MSTLNTTILNTSAPHPSNITLRGNAPAKLNLFLHLTGQRPDGYHLLETLFCPITLHDTLTLTLQSASHFTLTREGPLTQLPEHIDLTARAARLFFEHANLPTPWHLNIHVEKKIPEQAGLGGGSSDAATTLKLLQQHFNHPISTPILQQLALQLGADVPFFLQEQSAFAEGIGEQLQPLTVPDAWFLIYKPKESCSTQQIFADPLLTKNTNSIKMAVFDSRHSVESEFWKFIQSRTCNALQAAVERQKSEWKVQFQQFEKICALHNSLLTRMSGSGSAMFAVFDQKPSLHQAQQNIQNQTTSLSGELFECQVQSKGS